MLPFAATAAPKNRFHVEAQQVIEIKAIELAELIGKSFADLSVLSVKNGMLTPVPHQLEDFDVEGRSWFKESGVRLLGQENIVDPHDSLFFRYADTGQRLDSVDSGFTQIIAEIQILSSQTEDVRYLYVTDQLRALHHLPLTLYDQTTGIIRSQYFSLHTNPNDLLSWNDFTYATYQGNQQSSLLDTLKIRIEAGVVFDVASIAFDNSDIKTQVTAVKQGPIRTIILAKSQFLFARIPVLFLDIRFNILPQQFNIDVDINVPAILAAFLHNPRATISIDGNNLLGSDVLTTFNPTIPTKVDGQMSIAEQLLSSNLVTNGKSWIWLSTNAGFDIHTELHVPSNFKAPISLHYIDNLTLEETPERFAGQGPNIGYKIHQIPINDVFKFRFSAYFTDSIGGISPQEFAARIKDTPAIASQPIRDAFNLVQGPKQ